MAKRYNLNYLTMRKLLLLLVFVLPFLGCSSDDSPSVLTNDPVVGTWRSYKTLMPDGNGNMVESYINTECPDSFKSFTYNPDYTIIIYVSNECNITGEESASWSKEEPNLYTITGESGSNVLELDIDGEEMIMNMNSGSKIYLHKL